MPDNTFHLIPSTQNRVVDVGAFIMRNTIATLASGTAARPQANGDYIRLFTISAPLMLAAAIVGVSGTLGTSCTVQLFRNRAGTRVAITAASTAAAANRLIMTAQPIDLAVDDVIELAIAGAAITAVATIDTMLTVQRL
jgi:hypothetical protein